MTRILLGYGSSHGHTRDIAAAIAARLRERGCQVDLRDAGEGAMPPPDGYDAVVLGSRVHLSKHTAEIEKYVRRYAGALAGVPCAFFSVSMSAAANNAKGSADAQRIVDTFLEQTGWQPDRTATFAGELAYTRYSWVTRLVMKRISAAEGGSTDTSRDWDYTDWDAVARFADEVAADVAERPPAGARFTPEAVTAPCS